MKILVEGAVLQCTHGGQVKLTSGNAKLKIGGKGAVTQGMEAGLSFLPAGSPPTPAQPAPCPFMIGPNPSPCTTSPAIAGAALKLKVDSLPVLLDSATGVTINVPPATWSVQDAGQTLAEEA